MSEINLETISMEIIASSGEARSLAFRALKEAKNANYSKSKELLASSKSSALAAHKAQTQLLINEANGDNLNLNVLLIHAQDHLMTSMLAQDLIEEILYLHENKEEKKESN